MQEQEKEKGAQSAPQKPRCTLLVCSCDAYQDAWEPFFRLLRLQWPDCPFPIVLNTETARYTYADCRIRTLGLYAPGERVSWAKRLMDHLDAISTEYVLLFLDDFFLCKPVDTARVLECMRWMDADASAAAFNFYTVPGKNLPAPQYPGFVRRPQCGAYKYNAQAGLWRTRELRSFLRPHEAPWVWEVAGNYRSWRSRQKFYCADPAAPLVFDYYGDGCWSGIMRGRWYTKYVGPLFERYGIAVDFSKRGTIGDAEVQGIVDEQKKRFLWFLKTVYGNTLCVLKHPKSLF